MITIKALSRITWCIPIFSEFSATIGANPLNVKESESDSIVSDSLRPHGPYSPWNSPGQNIGVGGLSLLQGIFPPQGLNLDFPHCRWILYQLSLKGSPYGKYEVKSMGEGNKRGQWNWRSLERSTLDSKDKLVLLQSSNLISSFSYQCWNALKSAQFPLKIFIKIYPRKLFWIS